MDSGTVSHHKHNQIESRTAVVLILVVALLFMPPSVTMFRNPLPDKFVPMWWMRFGVSAGALFISSWALSGWNRVQGWIRMFHWLACAIAITIMVMLLQWPLAIRSCSVCRMRFEIGGATKCYVHPTMWVMKEVALEIV